MKILCKLFGHRWRYSFSPSDFSSKRINIRVCKYCNKVQQYKEIFTFSESEFFWMTMVGYTKKGAKDFWGMRI